MGYASVWKVLEEMIADFRKKGMKASQEVMDDLKSAKTMIRILKADPTNGENIQKMEKYLLNVESHIVSESQKKFGFRYVDEWLDRLDKAGREIHDEVEKETRFIPGVPRHQKWIRVTPSTELPLEKLKTVAKAMNIAYTVQKNRSLLVYGDDQKIKDFVKKTASKYRPKAKKYREKVHNG